MIYEYLCDDCERTFDVYKPVKNIDDPEICPQCKTHMTRQLSFQGHVTMGTFTEGYNPALGKAFSSKGELNNELARIRGETGKELIEVGNEQLPNSIEKKAPDLGAAREELKQQWQK